LIVDTSALVDWARSDARLLATLPSPQRLVLPVIVLGEYLSGAYRSTHREELESWLDRATSQVRIAAVNLQTARVYAAIRATLDSRGSPIPVNDTWIAALAVQLGLPVLSRDKHFDSVDDIQRISW
jgi:predicted nucleic acid-binding protein